MNLDKLNVQELSMEEKVNTEGGNLFSLIIMGLFILLDYVIGRYS